MTRRYCLAVAALVCAAALNGCSFIGPLFGLNRFKVEYSTATTAKDARIVAPAYADGRYTGYGDYVCSITPSRFILPVNQVFFFPSKDSGSQGHLEVTDSGRYWSTGDASLYLADFSHPEAAKEYQPQLTPGLSDFSHLLINLKFGPNRVTIIDSTGASKEFTNNPDIALPLPPGYEGVVLDVEKSGRARAGADLQCSDIEDMVAPALDGTKPAAWVFGNTDTTGLWTSAPGEGVGINIGMNKDWFHATPGNSVTLLRGPFSGLSLPAVFSKAVVSVSFDTAGLIQVYAGSDNAAYTADDVFVIAPEFWNRVQVSCKVD
jgi:hypothetical protein